MKRFLIAIGSAFVIAGANGTQSLLQQVEAEQVATIERGRAYVVAITMLQTSDGQGAILTGDASKIGSGSGAIVSADGKIITNTHVADAKGLVRRGMRADLVYGYKVTLSNKKVYDAELVALAGGDIDLALLKLKNPPRDLTVATLADSDQLRAGQIVFAIGSPLGLDDSVSSGIVSNVARSNEQISKSHKFIQTDAAINQGNSGGPLMNLNAEIVGINTFIMTTNGGNAGLGFAIPSKVVKEFLAGLQTKPRASGWVGVSVDSIDIYTRKMLSIPDDVSGLRIQTIDPHSTAVGKLQVGDVIQTLDGEVIAQAADWKRLVILKGEGTTVTLGIYRRGKVIEISIVLGKVPTK